MLTFILNNDTVQTSLPRGTTVLDFVRYHRHLMGTKIGCREGDCGACTVIVGEWMNDHARYRTMTSCLMPLQHAAGKHIITIEGINPKDGSLTPVQQAMVEENGTQCGFCTVGFVMSLSWLSFNQSPPTIDQAIASVDGNICRCTGYKSIERAAARICAALDANDNTSMIDRAIANGFIPAYLGSIPDRLKALQNQPLNESRTHGKIVAGGTDLYVQQQEQLTHADIVNVFDQSSLRQITEDENQIAIGGAATVTDLVESAILLAHFPRFREQIKLVSSTPIRNMATVAGNLVNASPIGDLTIWLLAMNATVVLKNSTTREVPLRDFYQGYKVMDKQADELIEKVVFKKPSSNAYFNFEKVSKRQHLDIATVNTALSMHIDDGVISHAHLSAGGVGPTPLFLKNTSSCLNQHQFPLDEEALREVQHVIQSEIHPIDDVRGSAAYKRLLMQQLFIAHLMQIGSAYAKH
jgi:xanthine dehydrogenase small subunit